MNKNLECADGWKQREISRNLNSNFSEDLLSSTHQVKANLVNSV